MSLAFRQIKVYFRVGVVLVVATAILLVVFKNRNHAVKFWFLWLVDDSQPTNVLWLMAWTSAATIAAWWTTSMAWKLWQDWAGLRVRRGFDQQSKLLDERSSRLSERERRVDEKIQDALSGDGPVSDQDKQVRDDMEGTD